MLAFPSRRFRLEIFNLVGSIEEISVIAAEHENDAIIDLRAMLESKPAIPQIVTAHAQIDRLDRPGGQQFVHLSLCIGRQCFVGRYAGAVGMGIANERVAAEAFDPEAWTPIAPTIQDTHR